MPGGDILIGVDAGASVIKAVAFDVAGFDPGSASVPHQYAAGPDGAVTQSLTRTDCAAVLCGFGAMAADLAARTAAVAAAELALPGKAWRNLTLTGRRDLDGEACVAPWVTPLRGATEAPAWGLPASARRQAVGKRDDRRSDT